MVDRYMAEVLPHKRASTIPNQARHLRWWRQQIGYALLEGVSPAMVAMYRDALVKRFSGSTANRYLAALSHAFTMAIKEWGWATDNPCLKVRRMREPRGRVRYLTDDERHRLLAECRESRNPYLYPVVVLALSTGARKGEILGLTWDRVDLARGHLHLEETKNGSRRTLPLTGHGLELLRARAQTGVLVFPGRGGVTRLDDGWRGAVKRAGLEDFRFHDLRHSAASYLAMSGCSLAEIAELLGRRSLDVTRRYAHLSTDHLAGLAARLDSKLFG
jgi:integrase